jgi:hypothetical protein
MTREEKKIEAFKSAMNLNIEEGDLYLEKFKTRLVEESNYPLAAFEWSEETIDALARRDVAKKCLHALKNLSGRTDSDPSNDWDVLMQMVLSETLRGARYPQRSTSPMANRVNQATVAAFGEVAMKWAAGVAVA